MRKEFAELQRRPKKLSFLLAPCLAGRTHVNALRLNLREGLYGQVDHNIFYATLARTGAGSVIALELGQAIPLEFRQLLVSIMTTIKE